MALSSVSVAWRDLVLGDATTGPYALRDISQWDELPGFSTDDAPVQGGHGALVAPIRFGVRQPTVTGWCFSASDRDVLVQGIRSSTAPLADTTAVEPLAVTMGGLTLTANARVVRAGNVDQAGWALGRFGWVVQWLCSDPLRYGPYTSASSVLAVAGTGLALPTTLPATIPANPIGGALSLNNTGTAAAPAVYRIQGPVSLPGFLLNAGTASQRSVTYNLTLAATDTLVLDTKAGAFLNGEYRAPVLGSNLAKEFELLPGSNSVAALGVASSGSSISVTFRPAYW